MALMLSVGVLVVLVCSSVRAQQVLPPESLPEEKFYIYSGRAWDKIATLSQSQRDPREILNGSYNGGGGDVVNAAQGMFHTDQYHLYDLVYFRLLTDPRRTLDPTEATSFFVPYDFSLDSAFYKNCVKSKGVCFDFRKCPFAPRVDALLRKSPHWQKSQGSDHFTIIGMNYAMEHYLNKPNCKSFLINACQNCTKFAIDDYSFLMAADDGVLLKGVNWHAVPFPSDFHWTRAFERPFPWEQAERPVLVSYIGTGDSYWLPAKRLRQSLIHYCSIHQECVHVGYGKNGTRSSMLVQGYSPLEVAKQSVFCLQPYGDLMTRKGLFDSLMMGCIPVTFSQLSASSMYVWHWSEQLWTKVAVQLGSKGVAHRYEDPISALKKLYTNDRAAVEEKLDLIRKHVFELHWATGSPHGGGAAPAAEPASETDASTWPRDPVSGKPQADAFEVLMRWVLGWHSGRLSQAFSTRGHIPDPGGPGANPCWTGTPNTDSTVCIPKVAKL